MEEAGADRGRADPRRRDDGGRPQAAALRPRALQVLLAVPLQTLQPRDAREKVFSTPPGIFHRDRELGVQDSVEPEKEGE